MDLLKDASPCEADEEWTGSVDRCVLCLVKNITHQLFCAVEFQTRDCLSVFMKPLSPPKAEMMKTSVSSEDVCYVCQLL